MNSTLLLLLLTTGGAMSAVDTVVVCGDAFRPTLAPWLEYRQQQGHEIRIVRPSATAEETRQHIERLYGDQPLRFIVLVGDTASTEFPEAAVPQATIPAKVNVHWGSETDIATDSVYADRDGDGVPDVAVGRLSADRPTELATMIRKIIDYEQCSNETGWRRRVNFVAGVGGFGAVADTILELSAKRLITTGIPAGYATTMTHASWRSPYFPDARRFNSTVLERLNEGCLFWVYVGHGQRRHLDWVVTPNRKAYDILQTSDVPAMQCRHGAPIALFLSCYAGAYDAEEDCLAEEMLRAPSGPIAVAASSRVAMPYGMTVLGTNLLKTCFQDRTETLGELFLAAHRRTLTERRDDAESKMLDSLAERLNPAGTTAAEERAETTRVFNLLGDPLLRIAYPVELPLEAPEKIEAGKTITVRGKAPFAGHCTVELVVRRDRLTFRTPRRDAYDESPGADQAYHDVYSRANDPRLVVSELHVKAGSFTATLNVPPTAGGECHIRAAIDGRESFALGARDVEITPARATSSVRTGDYSPSANSAIFRK